MVFLVIHPIVLDMEELQIFNAMVNKLIISRDSIYVGEVVIPFPGSVKTLGPISQFPDQQIMFEGRKSHKKRYFSSRVHQCQEEGVARCDIRLSICAWTGSPVSHSIQLERLV